MTAAARPRRARAAVSATFLVHAAAFGSWAPRIPAIKHAAGIDDAQPGIALTGLALGRLGGTRLASVAVGRLGSRPAIRCGSVLLCAALVGPSLARSLAGLVVALASCRLERRLPPRQPRGRRSARR